MAKGITLQELDASALVNLVPHLGTTSNSGDAYSITTSATIGANQKFTIKFNAASSSAPTLKINNGTAYPIVKSNGNNAKVYASVYSLFWDGTNFILQGEGGGGNVQPDQVEAGFTFTNDNGEQTGTLSKQEFVNQLVAKGVSATMSDPFNALAAKIGQISTGSRVSFFQTNTRTLDGISSVDLITIPAGKTFVFTTATTNNTSYCRAFGTSSGTLSNGENARAYLGIRTPSGGFSRNMVEAYASNSGLSVTTYVNLVEIDTVSMRYRYANSTGFSAWFTITGGQSSLIFYFGFNVYNPNNWDNTGIIYAQCRLEGVGVLI